MKDFFLPALAPLIFAAVFTLFALAVMLLVSHLSGWKTLARQFASAPEFTGQCWHLQTGFMRGGTKLKGALTLGGDTRVFYLAVMPLFRYHFPPLTIPWQQIHVRQLGASPNAAIELRLGREAAVPLRLNHTMADRLRHAAGDAWPGAPAAFSR